MVMVSTEWACGMDGKSYQAKLCFTTTTNLQCKVENPGIFQTQMGFVSPGVCGCPNNCNNQTIDGFSKGVCQPSGTCQCIKGWTGDDCSTADCSKSSQTCLGNGKCGSVEDSDVCQCKTGWTGDDCSVPLVPITPVKSTIPSTQYSSWDNYGNNHPIFNESTIATIHLTIDDSDLLFLLNPDNKQSDTYVKSGFLFYNQIISQQWDDLGVRLHGGLSRSFVKKSWKLSFDAFNKGRTWKQISKLQLKSMAIDPSYEREKMSMDVYYSMNVPIQRGSFCQLFVNDINYGLYMMIEDVDNQFLNSRFNNDDGLLYKCVGDLSYIGSDPDLYRNLTLPGPNHQPAYDPQTDQAEESFSMLEKLISIINLSPNSTFPSDIQSIFDVDLFIRTLVAEIATGQPEGMFDANNYFLYFNPDLKVFQFFRHDLDDSWGLWNTYRLMDVRNVFQWFQGGRGYRLPERILSVPSFRSSFISYFQKLLSVYFVNQSSSTLVQRMQQMHTMILPLAFSDEWHHLDYAWSFSDVSNSLTLNISRPTLSPFPFPSLETLSLLNFLSRRSSSAASQLSSPPSSPSRILL